MNKMIFKASKKFVVLEIKSSPILASATRMNWRLKFQLKISKFNVLFKFFALLNLSVHQFDSFVFGSTIKNRLVLTEDYYTI